MNRDKKIPNMLEKKKKEKNKKVDNGNPIDKYIFAINIHTYAPMKLILIVPCLT